MTDKPVIAVLGANGLIGHRLAADLSTDGFPVVAVARAFTAAQEAALHAAECVRTGVVDGEVKDLAALLAHWKVDIVVNTVGILQDTRPGESADVHTAFVERLCAAAKAQERSVTIVHLSVAGDGQDDATAFGRTKHAGEDVLRASGLPVVILRPGFVLARQAFGGSALLRSLAQLPVRLPRDLADRPCRITAASDIVGTVAFVARRWPGPATAETWDVMAPQAMTLGEVVAALRRHMGGPEPRVTSPAPLLWLGAKLGDASAWLGWRPPVRSTAIAELRRGVDGRPQAWIEATGIDPLPLDRALATEVSASVQDVWFARLYLLKPVILAVLVAFWCLSGLIALTVAYDAAHGMLTARGFSAGLATLVTIVSSLADIAVGLLIARQRTALAGLVVGIVQSLGYMAGAAVLTPDLWIEPLGALVKTGPAIVLMMVALAILRTR